MNTFKNTLFILVFSLASFVQGQVAPVDDHGLAIGGYDVVAYFSGTPQKGHKEYATKHKGVTYYFSSKANWKAFKKSPKSYLPQFDGYCAWGVGAKEAKIPHPILKPLILWMGNFTSSSMGLLTGNPSIPSSFGMRIRQI